MKPRDRKSHKVVGELLTSHPKQVFAMIRRCKLPKVVGTYCPAYVVFPRTGTCVSDISHQNFRARDAFLLVAPQIILHMEEGCMKAHNVR
jgi:hypothetical protein